MAYTKVIISGNQIETWHYARSLPQRRSNLFQKPRVRHSRDTPRRSDHIRRLAKGFRRIVRANLGTEHAPAFLTLTMLQILSLKESRRLYTAFLTRLRNRERKEFRAIAVPEFQKRGAVHFHVLIWGLTNEQIQKESTTRYLQRLWLAGFVDCIKTDGSPKLAGYLSKYMQKSMSDVRLRGEKAYSCTRSVLRPVSIATGAFSDLVEANVIPDGEPLQRFEFDTQYLGRCVYRRYSKDVSQYDSI